MLEAYAQDRRARAGGKPIDLPELWGGIECSITRTASGVRDQVRETGHWNRIEDLDAIAALGLRRIRYPVLFESVSPDCIEATDWTWHDRRLHRLNELGVEVVAGLVHHGCGPHYTNLLDPVFPELLATHAARVAERYPFITAFTPVNEPLTTARFSGLYGHWHPYGRDTTTFLKVLVAECLAVQAAMSAIRQINPSAELIQTEDIGKIFSTRPLNDQARYENDRRWLSLDLLTGRVRSDHGWYGICQQHGIPESDLIALVEQPCAPDIIGLNYYLTSDRFLDHNIGVYAPEVAGGNGRMRYADTEAFRSGAVTEPLGAGARLREAWVRYGLPVAITEVHNGCTREEQLRWLMDVWSEAVGLRSEGIDVRAVTAWSMLGSVDWNSLLTRRTGTFETGVFDVRGATPRPTLLATAVKALATEGTYAHPALERRGWWRQHATADPTRVVTLRHGRRWPILITGSRGTLGHAFLRVCQARGLDCVALARSDLDIADSRSIRLSIERHRPWAIINAAGYVRVEDAEREPEQCHRANADGAHALAVAAQQAGIPMVTFSSDLVFANGAKQSYVESDAPAPAGVYGHSKEDAERRVLADAPSALVVRTSAFFGPWDRCNFVHRALRSLSAGATFAALRSTTVSPTYVPHLVHAVLDLLMDGESGIWHLANVGAVSWADLARKAAHHAGLDSRGVADAEGNACSTVLASERGALLPDLRTALSEFVRDTQIDWRASERVPARA